ncbi:Zinc finger protein 184 [Papilio machaon]|uniref:Zinc finger protein 184 n=1 Tax=Papilio machaon TaxID=76193 RepID=A0A194R399_PAPMA|nr:Zinc finger protein 184 [Papilio machaon]
MATCRACLETNKEMRTFDEPFAIQYNLLTELEIVKDEPDSTITTENCLYSEVKSELKEESMDSAAFNNIYNNDNFETSEKFELPLFSISNVTSEATKTKRILKKNKIKQSVKFENEERKQLNKKKNKVKMKKPLKNEEEMKLTTKMKEAKIKRKLKEKQRAAELNLKKLCGICKASFEDSKELFDHLEGHKKDKMCQLCHETFTEWPEILGHRFRHTPDSQRRCHLCNKSCTSHVYMEHHYRKMHYDGSVRLKCNQCDRTYDTPRNLRKHKSSVHSDKQFICDDCGETFNTKGKIKTHVLRHTTAKPHVCKFCGYSTKYVSSLRDHKLRKHTALKVYCKGCGTVFSCQEKLDKHVCKQKSRVCPICGLKMHKSERIYSHLKTHEKEKPYKCELCGNTYMSKVALKAHLDKHNGNRTKQCEYCPATFYYGSALIKHRRIHTGERPYVCKTCGKSFTSNSNLKVHRQIHGEYLINKMVKTEDI